MEFGRFIRTAVALGYSKYAWFFKPSVETFFTKGFGKSSVAMGWGDGFCCGQIMGQGAKQRVGVVEASVLGL